MSKKILVIEQDATVIGEITDLLLPLGIEIFDATTIKEANHLLLDAETEKALIIFDPDTADLDGASYCRFINDNKLFENISVMLRSSLTAEDGKLLAFDWCADGYISSTEATADEFRADVARLLELQISATDDAADETSTMIDDDNGPVEICCVDEDSATTAAGWVVPEKREEAICQPGLSREELFKLTDEAVERIFKKAIEDMLPRIKEEMFTLIWEAMKKNPPEKD
jgi:DNA-binding response OmpR family regulator